MLVSTETQKKQRLLDLRRKTVKTPQRAYKSKRTQTSLRYTLWAGNVLELFRLNSGATELYSMLAENIDGACGAVVADQAYLASLMGVSRQTISKYIKFLESQLVLVKIAAF